MATTTTIQVEGMTCGHCVSAVQSEVGAIPGVRSVEVDLDSGQVVVTSDAPLDGEAIGRAVDEAGYEVAS
jgi:copper ion binding protein